MNKYLIRIKKIPIKTKLHIMKYMNQESYIVGYKKIHINYKAPIIEFKDYTRIWM
uniref:Cytochrome b6-f complex subunit PetP n=1 Tax=Erythroglossum lusitanicum TaxID=2575615 RepID=A0A4D6WW34_9FLOR|nr:cytochrome b6-f complex subunit PetP [Erythroglossum lusitanicum]